jgi:tRNA(fMet)-specific endonuclease VapC
MSFLLDTNICSYHLKSGDHSPVFSRMMQYGGQLYVSRLTAAELYAYAFRKNAKAVEQLDNFLNDVHIVEFDETCARKYGIIHATLAEFGIEIPSVDLMLAATAIVHHFLFVTHDTDIDPLRGRIDGFAAVDWLTGE